MSRHVTSSLAFTAAVAGTVSAASVDNIVPQQAIETAGQSHVSGDEKTQTVESVLSSSGERGVSLTLSSAPSPITEWTSALEREFTGLAAHIALEETLSTPQQARFRLLENKRSLLKDSLSVEERLYEVRRAEVVRKTIQALEEYVQFFKPQSIAEK
jgi:hypothetical protein